MNLRILEKSKISRAEENKQSQCVERCDWPTLAGDLKLACDWLRARIPGQQQLNGGAIDPAQRCQRGGCWRQKSQNWGHSEISDQRYAILFMICLAYLASSCLLHELSRHRVSAAAVPLPGLLPSSRRSRVHIVWPSIAILLLERERKRPKPFLGRLDMGKNLQICLQGPLEDLIANIDSKGFVFLSTMSCAIMLCALNIYLKEGCVNLLENEVNVAGRV